jgi:hypothetical protein
MTIKKVSGGKFQLVSKKTGKPLMKPGTREQAVKREGQVEYFKHKGGK